MDTDHLRSDEYYKNIVETLTEFVDRYQPGGVLTYVNKALAQFAGVDAETLLGKSFYSFIHEDDRKETIRQIESLCRENPTVVIENRIVRSDGNLSWNQWTHTGIFDENDTLVEYQSVGKDITEHKAAEDALRRSEEKYRNIYQSAALGIFRSTFDDRFIDVNPALARMLGYDSPEEVVNSITSISEQIYVIPTQRDRSASNALDAGGMVCIENRYRRKDGSEWNGLLHLRIITDQQGAPSHYEGFIDDITERKQHELAVKESELRFRSVMEGIPSVAVQGYALDGTVTFWNRASEGLYGFSAEETIGANLLDLIIPPEMREGVIEAVGHMKESGEPIPASELLLQRKDGSRVPVFSSHALLHTIDRQPELFCLDIDLSELKQTQLELTKSLAEAQRFRKALDHLPAYVYMKDIHGRYVYANQPTLKLFACSENELAGSNDTNYFPLETVKRLREVDSRVLSGEQTLEEIDVPMPEGGQRTYWEIKTPIYEDNEGRTIWGLCGVSTDITDRKRMEEALRESEFFFKESQRAAHIGSYRADYSGNHWTSSEVLDTIFGIDHTYNRSIQGWLDLVHPDDRDMMSRYLGEEVIAKRNAFSKEYRIVRRIDDSLRWVHGLGEASFDSNGNLVTLAGTIQDITERKLIEFERADFERQLLHAQKLESLGVLAGGIAHDFNNLLAVIIGRCSLAKMRPQSASDNIPSIEKAAERAAELCRQMLVYAGKTPFVEKEVNFHELVEEMVKMLQSTINKNVVIKFEGSTDIPLIKADASQVRQIVMNLIINASEAIGDAQGSIRVSLFQTHIKADHPEKDHLWKNIPPGLYACLEVTDTGCGMDDETKQRIFEPFYTTKFTGRGLGMSAALGIVKAHNGALQLFSQLGHGTTFKLFLPIQISESLGGEDTDSQTPSDSWLGSGTILLVEDEEQIILIAKVMMEALGFTVIEALNGRDALELFRNNAEKISMVVTDLGMPVMDGYLLCRELKALNPEMPIIISSGFGEADITSRIENEAAAGYISKPYNFNMVREVLRGVVEGIHPAKN